MFPMLVMNFLGHKLAPNRNHIRMNVDRDLDHDFVMHRRGFLRQKPKAATLLKR